MKIDQLKFIFLSFERAHLVPHLRLRHSNVTSISLSWGSRWVATTFDVFESLASVAIKQCLHLKVRRFWKLLCLLTFFLARQRESEQLTNLGPLIYPPDKFYAYERFVRSDWIVTLVGSSCRVFRAEQNELKIIEFGPADRNDQYVGLAQFDRKQ